MAHGDALGKRAPSQGGVERGLAWLGGTGISLVHYASSFAGTEVKDGLVQLGPAWTIRWSDSCPADRRSFHINNALIS